MSQAAAAMSDRLKLAEAACDAAIKAMAAAEREFLGSTAMPGHKHKSPATWDTGKPCNECRKWADAKEKLAAWRRATAPF